MVSSTCEIPPTEMAFETEHYESKNGFFVSVWGPCIWTFLHTMSFNYSNTPTMEQKKQYMNFILSLQNILPCGKCRKNLVKNFKKLPLTLDKMKNRETFSRYVYELHELINTMLKKKSGLTYEQVRDRFEAFRARCNEKKPANKTAKKKIAGERGCTEPLIGNVKSKCIISIVPKSSKEPTLKISKKCLPTHKRRSSTHKRRSSTHKRRSSTHKRRSSTH